MGRAVHLLMEILENLRARFFFVFGLFLKLIIHLKKQFVWSQTVAKVTYQL
jgi:hypothetical protein